MEDSHSAATPDALRCAPRDCITALLADDEAHARLYLRMVLRELGIATVWEAANGEEAVQLFAQHRPVIVFLDNNMPVLSGRMTIERLREIDPDAAVVVVTSENDINTVRHFAERGAVGYVLKHSPRQRLSQMIGEILDGFVIEAR